MIDKEQIGRVIAGYLQANGLFPIDTEISADNDITVTIESEKGSVTLDHCTEITRIIEEAFDRDREDYSLTVSSAGLDQPFKVLRQYLKFVGEEVEIAFGTGNKIKGILSAADEEKIELTTSQLVKEEGKKKRVRKEFRTEYPYGSFKSCRPVLAFK